MSWKIYDGFIFSESINTLELAFDYLKKIKNDIERLADQHWYEWITKIAVSNFDNDIENKNKNINYIANAYSILLDEEYNSKKSGLRSIFNVDFSISLAPVKIRRKSRIIGIVISNNNYIKNKFLSMDYINDLSYWDNSDLPDNITKEEFRERKKIWEKVFVNETSSVSENMLTFTLIPEGYRKFDIDNIKTYFQQYVPIFEERLEGVARYKLNSIIDMKGKSFDDFFKVIKSSEYKQKMKNEMDRLRPLLKNNIYIGDLINENR